MSESTRTVPGEYPERAETPEAEIDALLPAEEELRSQLETLLQIREEGGYP